MSPDYFGENITVEDCQRVPVSSYLKNFKTRFKELVLNSAVEVLGSKVNVIATHTQFEGSRFWFQCPYCERRVSALLIHPVTNKVGCRLCLGLSYRKSRFKGMVEAL